MTFQEIVSSKNINVLMFNSYQEYITAVDRILTDLQGDVMSDLYKCSEEVIADLSSEAWQYWHKVLDLLTDKYRACATTQQPSTKSALFELYVTACEWERVESLRQAWAMLEIARTFRDECLSKYMNWEKVKTV